MIRSLHLTSRLRATPSHHQAAKMALNVMTQALCTEDGSLPQGLTIQNAYTKMPNGSKNVAIVVRNSMAYPQTLRKKTPVVESSCGHMGARVTDTSQHDRGIGWGPRPPDAKADSETEAETIVWGVKIWVDWNPGHLSWQSPPSLSWLSTMMFSP